MWNVSFQPPYTLASEYLLQTPANNSAGTQTWLIFSTGISVTSLSNCRSYYYLLFTLCIFSAYVITLFQKAHIQSGLLEHSFYIGSVLTFQTGYTASPQATRHST